MKEKSFIQWLILTGLMGVVFYFSHVIVGVINYPGYNSLAQAVSDLTATNAPSHKISVALVSVSNLFLVSACTVMCVFYQKKATKTFRLGIYLFTIMQWVSAVGYTLFPLSESGYAGGFQDVMHMVTTAIVVPLSIVAMMLIIIASFKNKKIKPLGVITLTMLIIMFVGAIGVGIVPLKYFGIFERLSVYSVVLYSLILFLFTFFNKIKNLDIN